MTQNIEMFILKALQRMIIRAVDLSDYPTTPVKYIGLNFNPLPQQDWLEVVYIPNNIENEFWGEEKTYRGIMRLILHKTQNGEGIYDSMYKLENILNNITKGSKHSDPENNVIVKIEENPNITGVIEQSPEILIPATIRYIFFSLPNMEIIPSPDEEFSNDFSSAFA